MSTVQQSDDESLSSVAPLEPRRRKKEVRKRLSQWEESSVELIRSIVPHPTQTWLVPTSTCSRARNRGRCNWAFQGKRMIADRWSDGELDDSDLLMIATHWMGFCLELIRMSGREPTMENVMNAARELYEVDHEQDRVLVHAISDGVIDEDEAPRVIEACEEQEAETKALRMTVRAALQAGLLPEPDQVEASA